MRGVRDLPPNYEKIAIALPSAQQPGVLFAWGKIIYNPSGVSIPIWLRAHEGVHGRRQLAFEGGVEDWWDRYIEDSKFRMAEELPAHRAEFLTFCKYEKDEQKQYHFLNALADRLIGPLYGGSLDFKEAKKAIRSQ